MNLLIWKRFNLGIKIFTTCTNLIRTLPLLPVDNNNPEDVDTDAEDHAYDALRYGVMSRPVNPNSGVGFLQKEKDPKSVINI